MSQKFNSISQLFSQSKPWLGVILFTLLSLALLEQSLKKNWQEFEELQSMRIALENQIQSSLSLHEELLLEISSQSDSAWIELTLMKKFGLVPEGKRKVFFVPKGKT